MQNKAQILAFPHSSMSPTYTSFPNYITNHKQSHTTAVTSSGSKSKSKSKTKTGSSTDDLLAPEKSKTVPGPDIGEALDLNLEEVNGTSIDIDDDEADCTGIEF